MSDLRYGPGDVIIFMAGALFHSVTEWEPTEAEDMEGCTPGRIGHVFFFPEKTYTTLEEKERGWAEKTCGGLLPETAIATNDPSEEASSNGAEEMASNGTEEMASDSTEEVMSIGM